jgi:hypothetical protein
LQHHVPGGELRHDGLRMQQCRQQGGVVRCVFNTVVPLCGRPSHGGHQPDQQRVLAAASAAQSYCARVPGWQPRPPLPPAAVD